MNGIQISFACQTFHSAKRGRSIFPPDTENRLGTRLHPDREEERRPHGGATKRQHHEPIRCELMELRNLFFTASSAKSLVL